MWHFERYQKIQDNRQNWKLDTHIERKLGSLKWVVTEKIHGANLCIMSDGHRVKLAKRKGLLDVDDDFFGVWRLLPNLEAPILALFEHIKQHDQTIQQLNLYGELFGGHYPHPEVLSIENVQAVQTGVYYHPDLQFCAFDLSTYHGEEAVYFDDAFARHHVEAIGLMYAQALHIGTLDEAMAYSLNFNSTLPKRFGLPPLKDNLAEGVVIKPAQAYTIETPKGAIRPILKRKHPQFAEDHRYHQAQPSPQKGHVDPMVEVEWAMHTMLNVNRIQAAISKEGRPVNDQQHQALYQAIVEDIWADLLSAHAVALAKLGAPDVELLRAVLLDDVRELCATL